MDIRFDVTLTDTMNTTNYDVAQISVKIIESTSGWLKGTRNILDRVDSTNSFIMHLPVADRSAHTMEIQAMVRWQTIQFGREPSWQHKLSPIIYLSVQLNRMSLSSNTVSVHTSETAYDECSNGEFDSKYIGNIVKSSKKNFEFFIRPQYSDHEQQQKDTAIHWWHTKGKTGWTVDRTLWSSELDAFWHQERYSGTLVDTPGSD